MPNVWHTFDWSTVFWHFNRTDIASTCRKVKIKYRNHTCEGAAGWWLARIFLWPFIVLSVCVCVWPSGGICILIKNFYNYINSSRMEDGMPFVYLIFRLEAVQ